MSSTSCAEPFSSNTTWVDLTNGNLMYCSPWLITLPTLRRQSELLRRYNKRDVGVPEPWQEAATEYGQSSTTMFLGAFTTVLYSVHSNGRRISPNLRASFAYSRPTTTASHYTEHGNDVLQAMHWGPQWLAHLPWLMRIIAWWLSRRYTPDRLYMARCSLVCNAAPPQSHRDLSPSVCLAWDGGQLRVFLPAWELV